MRRTLYALAVAVAMSVAAYGTSHAVPIAPLSAAQTESGAITQVHYRYHHYYYYRHWHPYRYYGWRPYRYYWGYPYRYYYWRPYHPYRWGYRWWW